MVSRGGMSPRGGLTPVERDYPRIPVGEGEYLPPDLARAFVNDESDFGTASYDGEEPNGGPRVTMASPVRGEVLRAFLREHRTRRENPVTTVAHNNIDALLDSMESAVTGNNNNASNNNVLRDTDDAMFPSLRVPRTNGNTTNGNTTTGDTDDPNTTRGAFGIDIRAAARWLEQIVPVVVILSFAFLFKHVVSLAAFFWMTVVFHRADVGLRKAVGLKSLSSISHDDSIDDSALNANASAVSSAVTAAEASEMLRTMPSSPPRATGNEETGTNHSAASTTGNNHHTRVARLLTVFAICASAVSVVALLFPYDSCWEALVFQLVNENNFTFMDALWRSAMADVLLRVLTMCLKSIYLLAIDIIETHREKKKKKNKSGAQTVTTASTERRVTRTKRRKESASLACVEHCSLLIRCLVPITTWVGYFIGGLGSFGAAAVPVWSTMPGMTNQSEDIARLGACAATGAYVAVKIKAMLDRTNAVKESILTLKECVKDTTGLGTDTRPSTILETLAASNECTVCCDKFEDPVTMSCKHVFCEKCVGEWFERSRQCPLCRATVAGKACGSLEHGDGATVWFPYVF